MGALGALVGVGQHPLESGLRDSRRPVRGIFSRLFLSTIPVIETIVA